MESTCPADEWIKKMWCIGKIKYHSAFLAEDWWFSGFCQAFGATLSLLKHTPSLTGSQHLQRENSHCWTTQMASYKPIQ